MTGVQTCALPICAAARLIRKNVTPIKADSGADEIKTVLTRLVQSLKGSPPPWLRKALMQSQSAQLFEDDFETIEEEVIV